MFVQLGVGAAEQQRGGAEQSVQRRPERRREQHRSGADQSHRGRGEEDERQRRLLRLRRSWSVWATAPASVRHTTVFNGVFIRDGALKKHDTEDHIGPQPHC